MLETLYVLAITVEAMAVAIVAGRKKMDTFGILIIAIYKGLKLPKFNFDDSSTNGDKPKQ